MTSEELIDELRNRGVMLIRQDGTLTEIPPDFLETATAFCIENGCSSIIYEVYDPQENGRSKLTVTDCGFAE